jgi:hypothetical protein
MAGPLGVWELATGAITAIAVGEALEDAVAPKFELLSQTAWRNSPMKILDPASAAAAFVQALPGPVDYQDDAQRGGVGSARWGVLTGLAEQGPGVPAALELWRRGDIDQDDFDHAVAKAQLEPRWLAPLQATFVDRLDPAVVANAVQQGFMANDDLLPVAPSTDPGKVPTQGASSLDPIAEAQANGVDTDRLRILAQLAGLPPGPQELLDMLRRGIIEESDVERGIAQGHTKTEWAAAYLQLQNEVLSAPTVTQLRLRGWLTADDSYPLGELTGYDADTMDALYDASGRPASPGQMATAVARGFATEDDFNTAIVRSDIRPEYAPLLYAIRYNYPSLFFTKAAVQAGEVSDADAIQWLIFERYTEEVATKLVASWHQAKVATVKELTRADILEFYGARMIDEATATADLGNLGYTADETALLLERADAQRVIRYLNTAVGKVHSEYVGYKIAGNVAQAFLGQLGLPGTAVDDLLGEWAIERAANAPTLSAAQILTLLDHALITSQAAHDSLVNRGYTDIAARAEVSRYAAFGAPGALEAAYDMAL